MPFMDLNHSAYDYVYHKISKNDKMALLETFLES